MGSSMPRALKLLLPIAFLAVATGISLVMIQARPQAMQKPVAPPSLLVDVEVAHKRPVDFVVASHGSVVPRTQTVLISEVAGRIIGVSDAFVSGGFFKKGDVLIRIDPRNYASALKRARAGVAKARTQVATENALAGYAFLGSPEDLQKPQDLYRG